jgi:hypothetical protein
MRMFSYGSVLSYCSPKTALTDGTIIQETSLSNRICQSLFSPRSFCHRARQRIEETSRKKTRLQLFLWGQDTRDLFESDIAPQDMRGFDPVIVTTCGDKINDVISIQVRALHHFALLFLEA